MKTLFDDMRSEQNLFTAWRHVKRSALNSSNKKIRGHAAEFEHLHQRHLGRIGDQIRENRFVFDKAIGLLKDVKSRTAEGKDPRPIALSTLKNRVVHRAILQVLQPRTPRNTKELNTRYESKRDPRLGKINDINESNYGVGGLLKPYGGVEPAIRTIRGAIDDGATFFFQSDIKAFFTKIPTRSVVDFVSAEVGDPKFIDFFERGLQTELENEDELMTYANLFPSGGIGVAQGSSLSAFAGNVLLYDLDHELNRGNVVAVRYIDDLLMVSNSQADLDHAVAHAKRELVQLGFSLYTPVKGSDKAASGRCVNSINFLGCTIQPNRCVPSKNSVGRLKNDTSELILKSKHAITATVKGGKPLKKEYAQSAVIDKIGKKMFGWQQSFSFCTDSAPFKDLDDDISKRIDSYIEYIYRISKNIDNPTKANILGIPSLQYNFLKIKEKYI